MSVKTSETQSSADGRVDDRFSEDGNSNADSDGDREFEKEAQEKKNTELKFACLLLKLENYFYSTAIEKMLTELHYLISSASVSVSDKVILDTVPLRITTSV